MKACRHFVSSKDATLLGADMSQPYLQEPGDSYLSGPQSAGDSARASKVPTDRPKTRCHKIGKRLRIGAAIVSDEIAVRYSRDSEPRYWVIKCTFSGRAPSAARPLLRFLAALPLGWSSAGPNKLIHRWRCRLAGEAEGERPRLRSLPTLFQHQP